jgi:two-component system, OmpR family, response regulator ChvI
LGKRVLIVDDEKDITESLKVGLERQGFEVETYNDPLGALSVYKAGVYDSIILDIRMPGMSGFELFRELRKKDKKTAIIFLTAFEMYREEFRRLFPDMAVQGFLQKPISIALLVAQIKKH